MTYWEVNATDIYDRSAKIFHFNIRGRMNNGEQTEDDGKWK